MTLPLALVVFTLVALIATLSATELVRVTAHRLQAVDAPGGRRVHRRPTARLGGLGIFWGFTVSMLLATYGRVLLDPLQGGDFGMIGMLAGSGLLLMVGIADDVRGLGAVSKLLFQIGAASVLYASGWRVESIGIPGWGVWATGNTAFPLTLLWVLAVTNAVNLIDGLDGLACGIALIATFAIAALIAPGGSPLLLATAALGGALIGFLWYNLHPAQIFMGDAGSLFVGFVLSGMTLRAGQIASSEAFPLVPALLLAVPLLDTCNAILRRAGGAARGARSIPDLVRAVRKRLFAPDGHHIHHRLLRAGLSAWQAAAVLWTAAAGFAIAGCVLAVAPLMGYALIAALMLAVGWGHAHVRSRERASVPWPRAATASASAQSEAQIEAPRRAA
jgi:UDP-GlcNAc:undecaprenyl-phosphate GlcNAc-1-phosphate transferase